MPFCHGGVSGTRGIKVAYRMRSMRRPSSRAAGSRQPSWSATAHVRRIRPRKAIPGWRGTTPNGVRRRGVELPGVARAPVRTEVAASSFLATLAASRWTPGNWESNRERLAAADTDCGRL